MEFTNNLFNLILKIEADSVFDKENFSEQDADTLKYLKEFAQLKAVTKISYNKDAKKACVLGFIPKTNEEKKSNAKVNKLPNQYDDDYNSEAYCKLKNTLKTEFLKNNISDIYSGISRGTELCTCDSVFELQKLGYDINLHARVAYQNYNVKNPMYEVVQRKAQEFTVASKKEYSVEAFNDCTSYLLNSSDVIFVVCDIKQKNYNVFAKKLNEVKEKGKKIILLDYNNYSVKEY